MSTVIAASTRRFAKQLAQPLAHDDSVFGSSGSKRAHKEESLTDKIDPRDFAVRRFVDLRASASLRSLRQPAQELEIALLHSRRFVVAHRRLADQSRVKAAGSLRRLVRTWSNDRRFPRR